MKLDLPEYFSARVITVHVLDPVSKATIDGAAFADEPDVCAFCGEEFASHSNQAIEDHRIRSLTDPTLDAGEDPANYGRAR